jgi:enoyl-[acyl-carrier protein] reductase I
MAQNIRVNAISAGPVRTLAGSGVSDARVMFNYQKRNSPLGRTVSHSRRSAARAVSPVGPRVRRDRRDPLRRQRFSTCPMPRLDALKTQEARAQKVIEDV